jgi:hypothetical protein
MKNKETARVHGLVCGKGKPLEKDCILKELRPEALQSSGSVGDHAES